MQKLTITFEDTEYPGKWSASYEQENDITLDDMFWAWFISIWHPLGLSGITNELKKPVKHD